jgi:chromate transport protein ChrA
MQWRFAAGFICAGVVLGFAFKYGLRNEETQKWVGICGFGAGMLFPIIVLIPIVVVLVGFAIWVAGKYRQENARLIDVTPEEPVMPPPPRIEDARLEAMQRAMDEGAPIEALQEQMRWLRGKD